MLDLSKPNDAHIDQRLRSDVIMWLGSVRPDGRPHLVVVWFLWDGEKVIIFSRTPNQKLRNIRNNPQVILALDDTNGGSDPITIEGEAELVEDAEFTATMPAYAEKYAAFMARNGWDPPQMASLYSQAIVVRPTRFL